MNLIQNDRAGRDRAAGQEVPGFAPGDTVIVNVNVVEGDRKRVQAYEGVVIAKRNRGLNSSFIVRKISSGEGVERTFQTYSPLIASIEVKRRGDVRRAKLYYLRERSGKSARIREKLHSGRKARPAEPNPSRSSKHQRGRLGSVRRRAIGASPSSLGEPCSLHGVRRIGDARGLQRETGRAVRCNGHPHARRAPDRNRIPAAGRGDTRARRCVLARSLPSAQRVFRRSRVSPRSALFEWQGTGYQHRVWEAVRAIPLGATRSYLDVAQQIGSAPRPVGTACGANRIPLLIPCHRVVGSSGLGGFMHSRGGKPLEIKRWLLRHEGALK